MNRPNTQFIVQKITHLNVQVTRQKSVLIRGDSVHVPEYIESRNGLLPLTHDARTHAIYQDNLCFFRALGASRLLAAAKNKNADGKLHAKQKQVLYGLEREVRRLFDQWLTFNLNSDGVVAVSGENVIADARRLGRLHRDAFAGVRLEDLDSLERCFGLQIGVWKLEAIVLPEVARGNDEEEDADAQDLTCGEYSQRYAGRHRRSDPYEDEDQYGEEGLIRLHEREAQAFREGRIGAVLMKRSTRCGEPLHLNIFNGSDGISHFSLITDLDAYAGTYVCASCGRTYPRHKEYLQHLRRGCRGAETQERHA